MARAESKMIMGYLPIDDHHHAAILSLVAPANPAVKMLDPFAGDGAFLEVAARAWNLTPYANELDGERARGCIARFGPKQAVHSDVERLSASNSAFGMAWLNPPYDHSSVEESGNKRVEFIFLKHAWKWIQDGGVAMWCIYRHHITEAAATFLAKHCTQVDVWGLPGKHLGEYDQIVVVGIKGVNGNPEPLYRKIMAEKAEPRVLTIQPEPLYSLPKPPTLKQFIFAPDVIDEVQGYRLVVEQGAWKSNGFQSLLMPPAKIEQIEPVVAPRPGHMALVLAAGVANGAVIDTEERGTVAIRGKTVPVEEVARVEAVQDPANPQAETIKTTIRLKPTTTLTLLSESGEITPLEGDEALLDFITSNKRALADYLNGKFKPMYQFDMNGIGGWLSRIRLNGKYAMYGAQKHVVGAVTRGLQDRKGILLVGSMGTGKTVMGGATAIALASGVVEGIRNQIRDDQVVLVVAPPHLIVKWKRELESLSKNVYVERLDRHEDVKAFMEKASLMGGGIAKIGLIKRDLTKLGTSRESGVLWRDEPVALWRRYQYTPEGYEPHQRVTRKRVPKCPCCGETVMQTRKGNEVMASETWLKSGKRYCSKCNTPLWQEARDRSSALDAKTGMVVRNPRYRLDEYIKRMYPDRIFMLIWDEVHEAQHGDTGNGQAFNRLAGVSKKILAMTGTPFNGRSSSIFNLEYALNPRVRQRYNWGGATRLSRKVRGREKFQKELDGTGSRRGRAESRWVADMGVLEQVVEERPSFDPVTGVMTGTNTYQRPYEEAPGISPLLVAEVLDHAIFFSLGDLGKALPQYEEIAVPVELDDDVDHAYKHTRDQLKDYLITRRWEGDVSFRGAYLQWAMGWPNAAHRPHEVIHNIKHPVTGEITPFTVTQLPSFGEDRLYAKEQALVDLVASELEQDRPCVIYVRQTATRDIQPRLEQLIREHVPLAQTYILKNTVSAERREAVINAEVTKGTNVIISNPELVKTGLDLVFAPTLIFYEIVFNLGTMMQAAGRSYRLNQTHSHCKTYYLFAEGTMEHTAVQLMSRKQRAAKLLTGDIGLTGLDALTEGESGLEQALLDAIGRDDSLLDPSEMFKANAAHAEINGEDASFWNIEEEAEQDEPEPVIQIVEPEPEPAIVQIWPTKRSPRANSVLAYFDTVHIVIDEARLDDLRSELLALLADHPDNIRGWLKANRVVFPGCEAEVAAQLLHFADVGDVPQIVPVQQAEPVAPVELPKPEPKRTRATAATTHPHQLSLF